LTTDVQQILSIAVSQIGYHEGQDKDGTWNNIEQYAEQVPGLAWAQGQPWCAVFVSWVAEQAKLNALFPLTASCAAGVEWFQKVNRWSEYPAIGAQVFFGAGGGEHTGIVESYDDTTIWTVEGNANDGHAPAGVGDAVIRTTHVRTDAYVYGYGYPHYPDGITSADPAWAPHAPAAPAPPAGTQPFPGVAWFHGAHKSPIVTQMGERLVAEDCSAYKVGPGPQWTDADRQSYQKWQLKLGFHGTEPGGDADGWPGALSWAALKVPHTP
jgi:hypothetical protein